MKIFFKKYKHSLWFLLFFAIWILYYIPQFFGLGNYNVVHLKTDDFIPFVPIFAIPYLIWYIYVPLPMIYMCFKNKSIFYMQVLTLFIGSILSGIFFLIYPTCIDFRPTEVGEDVFSKLCMLIFNADKPINVLPSLHCYEAAAVHLATFCNGKIKINTPLRVFSAVLLVLICLSTVFIKQHSVLDMVSGVIFAVLVFTVVKIISKK